MLSSIGGGIDARPPTARARYPCPFRLATSLCENPALAQKLIGRHHLAQSRLMAAVAAANLVLVAVPCFIFMGTMLERSGVANDLLDILEILLRRVPGGLALAVTVKIGRAHV